MDALGQKAHYLIARLSTPIIFNYGALSVKSPWAGRMPGWSTTPASGGHPVLLWPANYKPTKIASSAKVGQRRPRWCMEVCKGPEAHAIFAWRAIVFVWALTRKRKTLLLINQFICYIHTEPRSNQYL